MGFLNPCHFTWWNRDQEITGTVIITILAISVCLGFAEKAFRMLKLVHYTQYRYTVSFRNFAV